MASLLEGEGFTLTRNACMWYDYFFTFATLEKKTVDLPVNPPVLYSQSHLCSQSIRKHVGLNVHFIRNTIFTQQVHLHTGEHRVGSCATFALEISRTNRTHPHPSSKLK